MGKPLLVIKGNKSLHLLRPFLLVAKTLPIAPSLASTVSVFLFCLAKVQHLNSSCCFNQSLLTLHILSTQHLQNWWNYGLKFIYQVYTKLPFSSKLYWSSFSSLNFSVYYLKLAQSHQNLKIITESAIYPNQSSFCNKFP